MPNSSVSVEILMTRTEFFCDIVFTVKDKVSLLPLLGVWIELKTLALQLITKVQTGVDGKATIQDMPVNETYNWFANKSDYSPIIGQVTTVKS